MKRIALISCSRQKLSRPAPAKELYTSPLFTKAWRYAQTYNPDAVYILSAKHGLLDPEQEIAPYDLTLSTFSAAEKKQWAQWVLAFLADISPLDQTEYIILAGKKYSQYLIPHMPHHQDPLAGLSFGQRLKFLTEHTA